MKLQNFPEEDSSYVKEGMINDEILGILQEYVIKASNITVHKKKKELLMEMMSSLIERINTLAKNGNSFEVGGYLSSAAYFLEEFDFKEAQQIYSKSIEFFKKDMTNLQKEGKFKEASKIAIQIADLYHNKLNDREAEKEYIYKCIEFNTAQLNIIEDFFEPRNIAILLFNLGELYIKVEDWSQAIKVNQEALKIVLENQFYDIIVNIYFNLSDIYLFSGDENKADEIIEEARMYFSSEEQKYVDENNFYMLSQIYQIQKNLSSSLDEASDFRKYSRKEAYSYIELGKHSLDQTKDLQKSASFYRGAALVYKETESDYLEGASCFLIAGNLYAQISDKNPAHMEASYCFNDAAELFEHSEYHEKAINLYDLASKYAIKENRYEYAIEKLMKAYDLIKRKNMKSSLEEFALKICKSLEKISLFEAKSDRFFVSGTLLLETLPYYKDIGYTSNSARIKKILRKIEKYYNLEYERNLDSEKNTALGYIVALNAITLIALENYSKAREKVKILEEDIRSKNLSSIMTEAYKKIVLSMLESREKGVKFDLSQQQRRVKKIFSNSIEIKLFNNFIFY